MKAMIYTQDQFWNVIAMKKYCAFWVVGEVDLGTMRLWAIGQSMKHIRELYPFLKDRITYQGIVDRYYRELERDAPQD